MKKHIDDVQTPTVDEHFKLLLEDDSAINLKRNYLTSDDLPDWYDEKLYKKTQNLFKRNMVSIVTANLVGFISLLSITTIAKVLIHTERSSTPGRAFKRYLETILHVQNIYTCDPNNSDSKWYKTINIINRKHNMSNKKSQSDGIGKISQKNMVLTQCAFVAYVLTADKSFGIRATTEEKEAFNHFWRVNGYMFGISNRLNICRKTVKETCELCQMVLNTVYTKNLNEFSREFYHLASTALEGLWYFDMNLDKDAMLSLTYRIHGIQYKKPLGWYSWLNMKYRDLLFYLFLLPYIGPIFKIYNNYLIIFMLWFVQKWPLLAWAKFGKRDSQLNLYPIHK